jgi:hypothetical protein
MSSAIEHGLDSDLSNVKIVFDDFMLNNKPLINFKPTDNKAVAYNLDKKYYTLKFIPKKYRTNNPEEVRFIFAYKFNVLTYGVYQDGSRGEQFNVSFTIFDTITSSPIKWFELRGSQPPATKTGSGGRGGSLPGQSLATDKMITEYIETIIQQGNYWDK